QSPLIIRSFPDERALEPGLQRQQVRLPAQSNGCKDFPPKKAWPPPAPSRPGPPHKTLLRCSSAELGPHSAPRMEDDDVRTASSSTASLTQRHTPPAAPLTGPPTPRTAGAAPPPPPVGRRCPGRATRPPPRSGRASPAAS